MMTEDLIEAYYRAWLDSDREKARSLLADDLKFRSPEDNFDSADDFLDKCWRYSKGFDRMTVEQAVYAPDGAYVVYSSGDLCCGELLKVRDGKIHEIYVTFNPTH